MEEIVKKPRKKRGPYKKTRMRLAVPIETPKNIDCLIYYVENLEDSNKIVFMDLNLNVFVIFQKDKPFPTMNITSHPQIKGNENKVISQLISIDKNVNLPYIEL